MAEVSDIEFGFRSLLWNSGSEAALQPLTEQELRNFVYAFLKNEYTSSHGTPYDPNIPATPFVSIEPFRVTMWWDIGRLMRYPANRSWDTTSKRHNEQLDQIIQDLALDSQLIRDIMFNFTEDLENIRFHRQHTKLARAKDSMGLANCFRKHHKLASALWPDADSDAHANPTSRYEQKRGQKVLYWIDKTTTKYFWNMPLSIDAPFNLRLSLRNQSTLFGLRKTTWTDYYDIPHSPRQVAARVQARQHRQRESRIHPIDLTGFEVNHVFDILPAYDDTPPSYEDVSSQSSEEPAGPPPVYLEV